jgi:double-stranded uracil-DNA glycosylase
MNLEDVLPDVLGPGLRVVFCGTAAGAVSAVRGAYYAGPGIPGRTILVSDLG